jgi:Flp pilus assembly pilin Flp
VIRAFKAEEHGQDLAEYCLLTALVALVAVGILIHFSGGMQALWGTADTALVAGNAASSGGTTGDAGSAASPGSH